MLRKQVSIGLFALLLCHILASAIVGIGSWWRAENDLSERLQVYRSVDSILEFQIPLTNQTECASITRTTEDGFSYHGHYYSVVSLEIKGNTLYIAGLETRSPQVWQDDLLSFLNDHLGTSSRDSNKTNELLKLLLKEYSPTKTLALHPLGYIRQLADRIPDSTVTFTTRSVAIPSPPPRQV